MSRHALAGLDVGHYRIPLPVVLSDSTHGDISHFELVTVRLRDGEGGEGVGYTYTVGAGGTAIRALLEWGLRYVPGTVRPELPDRPATRSPAE